MKIVCYKKDKLINSDFLSQEQELEYTERLQQVMTGPEPKGHSVGGAGDTVMEVCTLK